MEKASIYIFDQDERLRTIIGGKAPGACPFFDAEFKEQLNGEISLRFTVPADHEDAAHIVEENLVVIRDTDGKYRLFQIREIREDRIAGTIEVTCEDAAIAELNDEVIEGGYRPSHPHEALHEALSATPGGSRWKVGHVDTSFPTGRSTDFYYVSVMEAITRILETWDAEVRFRVEIEGGRITGRYVDLFVRRGTDTGKRFEVGKDITGIERTIDTTEVKTALYGRGKGEETEDGGYGRRITFADLNGGKEWIEDADATRRFGRPDPKWGQGAVPGIRPRFGVYINEEIEDPAELLEETKKKLAELSQPKVTYSLSVVDLSNLAGFEHERVRLGDTVRVIDRKFQPALEIEARVIEITHYLDEPHKTQIVLGNFKPTIADVTREIKRELERKISKGDPINWLSDKMETLADELRATNGYIYMSPQDGILVTDKPKEENPTSAIQIKGGIMAIAKEYDAAKGDFNWRTFGTGEGFTADLIGAGTLNADKVRVRSEAIDREIEMYNGQIQAWYKGNLTQVMSGHNLLFFDHGLYHPGGEVDKSEAGRIGFSTASDGLYRGVGVIGRKDFVTLGYYHKPDTTGRFGFLFRTNLYANNKSHFYTFLGDSSMQEDGTIDYDTFRDMHLFPDSRGIYDDPIGYGITPGISILKGVHSGRRYGAVRVFVGERGVDFGEDDYAHFGVYKIHKDDPNYASETVFLVDPMGEKIYLGPNMAYLDYRLNSTDGTAIRLHAGPNTYLYIGHGRSLFDFRGNYSGESQIMMRLIRSGQGAILQIRDPNSGTMKQVFP